MAYWPSESLKKFLTNRRQDLDELAVKEIFNLLPVQLHLAGDKPEEVACPGKRVRMVNFGSVLQPDGRYWYLVKDFVVPEYDPENEFLQVFLDWGTITEGLVYLDGKMYSGLATAIWDDRQPVSLPALEPGRKLKLQIRLYSGAHWGSLASFGPQVLQKLELRRVSKAIFNLSELFGCLVEMAQVLDQEKAAAEPYYAILHEAFRRIDFLYPENLEQSCRQVAGFLRENLLGQEKTLPFTLYAFGHAHLDLAWLWELAVTREKAIRTFATQVFLLKNYPYWIFQQGQAQLYQYLTEDAPALYQQIQELARQGRWDASGALWVECDTNLPGGESLIRQVLYGKEFFKKEFGVDCQTVWLPDSFGFSANLPQILSRSGIKLFITSKISWNETNDFPYHTFWWEGIDGSQILAHFLVTPTASGYATCNTILSPQQVYRTYQVYRQSQACRCQLIPFGYGDGGGGPKEAMVRRFQILRQGLSGNVRVKEATLENFRRCLLRQAQGQKLPVWVGELYLEFHRGTYTTQATVKKLNREAENSLKATEIFSWFLPEPQSVQTTLEQAWKTVLVNQFHDILPGSSIGEVYRESNRQLKAVKDVCRKLQHEVWTRLSQPAESSLTVFNPFSWNWSGYLQLPGDWPAPVAFPWARDEKSLWVEVENLAPWSFAEIALKSASAGKPERVRQKKRREEPVLENAFCRLRLDPESGTIVSLKLKQPVLELAGQPGLNILELYQDKSLDPKMSAWNLDEVHQSMLYQRGGSLLRPLSLVETVLFQKATLVRKIGHSTVVQHLYLFRKEPMVRILTEVNWQERECVLKAWFPTAFRTAQATCEVQFGALERPSHTNTSYEQARF
ncbi:MAG TPA: glycoside hydrolase family 38 C-terminal domain-containing protein, partial [bacterium]|nr:glycoside hydrolase family 38 C-terminal domain-containing protein [bacterium]